MPNTIKIKRGLEANRSAVTPQEGEFLYTTDTKKVFIGDGSTAGGNAIGDVVGPASATANGIALYDGTTGKLLKSGLNNGTAGQALLSGGAGNAPTWGSVESGVAQFTSNGAINAGQSVVLRNDGKVETISGVNQTETLGAQTLNQTSGSPRNLVTYAIPGTNTYAFVFNSSNDSTPRIGLASVTGNTISYGTIQQLDTTAGYTSFVLAWHPIEQRLVVIYTSPTLGCKAKLLTISGTTISNISALSGSFGYSAENNQMMGYYDATSNRIVVATALSGTGTIRLYSVNASTNTVTEVTTTTLAGTSTITVLKGFETNGTNGLIIFQDFLSPNFRVRAAVINVTATTITINTPSLIATGASAPWDSTSLAYDSLLNNFVAIYDDPAQSKSYWASFSITATSVSTIGGAQFQSVRIQLPSLTYDAYARRFVAIYFITTNLCHVTTFSSAAGILTATGTTTFTGNSTAQSMKATFVSGANRDVLTLFSPSGGVEARAFQPASFYTTAGDFLGIAASTVAGADQTVNVTLIGGINRNVTGLTANAEYWVGADGTLQTTVGIVRVGRAISATAIQLEDRLAASGTPSTSTFLRGDGAWAVPASSLELIAAITPTAVATLVIDNVFTATYENYLVYFQGTSVTSNGAYSTMQFIDRSTGSAITSDYYSINGWTSGSTSPATGSAMAGPLRNAMSSGTNFPPGSDMVIFNASKNPSYFGRQVNYYGTSGSIYLTAGGATTATSGIRGFSLTLSAGTFVAQGKVLIFGIKA